MSIVDLAIGFVVSFFAFLAGALGWCAVADSGVITMSIVDLAIGFVVGFFAFPFLLVLLARMAPNDDEFIRNYRTRE